MQVKLCDFGCFVRFENLNSNIYLKGATPAFSKPEIVKICEKSQEVKASIAI